MAKKKHGNTKFSLELFEAICDDLSGSRKGLHVHCANHDITPKTFHKWKREDDKLKEKGLELSHIYTRAKELQADYINDLMVEVAFDDADDEKPFVGANHIQRDKLKLDALKITSARLRPDKYGDKIDVTSKGNELKAPITGMIINNTESNEDDSE